MKPPRPLQPATLLLAAPDASTTTGTDRPHAPALYQTVAYEAEDFAALGEAAAGSRYFYVRHGAPNERAAGSLLSRLESRGLPADAEPVDTALLSSGMAAVEAAVAAAIEAHRDLRAAGGSDGAGDRPLVVVASGLYSAAMALLSSLARSGQFELHDGALASADELAAFLSRPGTAGRVAVIYCELLTNPRLRIPDIHALAALARGLGATLVVDATFATPLLCRPLVHGAGLVVHSATKFLGGHGDLCVGVVTGRQALIERVVAFRRLHGAVVDPFAAWLLQRSLRTLSVRLGRQVDNAEALARFLVEHADELGLREVIYPGLPSHPDHQRARALLDRPGAMLSIVVANEAAARRAYERVEVLRRVTSLGDVESLLMYPAAVWGQTMSPSEQQRLGISPALLRISVGIEDIGDLTADLYEALRPPM